MRVLVMNPGGNSLKMELVSCFPAQQRASQGQVLLSLMVEGIGKSPVFSVMQRKNAVHTEPIQARSYGEAAAALLCKLQQEERFAAQDVDCVGVRVVHGGNVFSSAPPRHRPVVPVLK